MMFSVLGLGMTDIGILRHILANFFIQRLQTFLLLSHLYVLTFFILI